MSEEELESLFPVSDFKQDIYFAVLCLRHTKKSLCLFASYTASFCDHFKMLLKAPSHVFIDYIRIDIPIMPRVLFNKS